MLKSSQGRIVLAIAAVTSLVLLAACSSSGGSTGNGGSKAPIKLGIVGDLSGPFAGPAGTEAVVGAKAAVDYINTEVNGFGGRKLQVVQCDTQSSGAGALTCANKLVAAKVDWVVGLSGFWASNGLQTISKANIVNQTIPLQRQEVTDPNAFPVGGGIYTEFGGQSTYAVKNMGASNGVAIFFDTGPLSALSWDLYKAPWDRAGKKVNEVLVPITSADLSPSIAKALSYRPDAIVVGMGTVQTQQLYEGLARQGYDMTKVISTSAVADIDQFFSKATDKSSIEGTLNSGQVSSFDDLSDPEIAVFRHAMQTYGHVPGRAAFYQLGFSPILTDYLVAKRMGFDKFDKTSLKDAFITQKVPVFMGYEYDHSSAPKDLPQVGASYIRFVQYKNGTLVNKNDGFINGFTGATVKRGSSPFAGLPG
jgi:ABC-type branched-subunit amino acid transport system substrate-binding protein